MTPGDTAAVRPILLVEDRPEDAELTIRALKQASVLNPVDVVGDGELALQYLRVRRFHVSRFDFPVLILLDLKLPKLDGFGVLTRLEAEGTLQELPVIVVTSSKEQEAALASYSLGVRAFIRKPIDFASLRDAVLKLKLHWMLVAEEPVRKPAP